MVKPDEMKGNLFSSDSAWIWLEKAPDCNCYGQFRTAFSIPDMPAAFSTKLYISAEGQYALFLNGTYVPSGQYADFPEYKAVQMPDITPFLSPGKNLLEIWVWYPGTDTLVSRRETPGLRFEIRQAPKQREDSQQTENLPEASQPRERILCCSSTACEARLLPGYVQGPLENITPQLGMTFRYEPPRPQAWKKAVLSNKSAVPVPRPVRELSVGTAPEVSIKSQGIFRLAADSADSPFGEQLLSANGSPAGKGFQAKDDSTAGERLQRAGLYFRDFGSLSDAGSRKLPAPSGLPLKVRSGDGIFLLLDLGRMTSGYLALDITAPEEAKVDIGFGEHLEDLRVRTSIGGRSFVVTSCIGPQRSRFVHYFRRLGCRYLQIFLHCREAMLYEAGILPVTYPVDESISFVSSDSLHNQIYRTAKRTLHLCMHEHYEDCPWREQALYGFDSRNQMLSGYYAFGEYTYPRENLRLLALSQRNDGLLELCAPARASITIPSFSLAFVVALEEYCRYSGDLDFGREMLGTANRILESFFAQVKDGIAWNYSDIGYWNFYEWNPLLDGTPIHRSEKASPSADAGLQLFGLLATQRMALLHQYLDLPVHTLEEKCGILIEGLEQFWDEQAGAYVSFLPKEAKLQYAELVQSLALYTKACPAHRAPDLCRGLMEDRWLPVTLSYSIFKYEALLQESEQYAGPVFHQIAERWGHMLYSDATAFWETDRGPEDFDGAGSLCHGWSGIPVYLYGRYLSGIHPVSPGIWYPDKRADCGVHILSATLQTPKATIKIGATPGRRPENWFCLLNAGEKIYL